MRGDPYNGFAADRWSIGVVLFIMLTSRLPYRLENLQWVATRQGTGFDSLTFPKHVSNCKLIFYVFLLRDYYRGASLTKMITGTSLTKMITGASLTILITGASLTKMITGASLTKMITGASLTKMITGASLTKMITREKTDHHCVLILSSWKIICEAVKW